MNDPMTEINDVQPTSVNHIVGQSSVIQQVKVALEAAWNDQRKFDHALLVGPPGLGKTAVAQVVAAEMASDYHEVLGQSIKGAGDLNGLLLDTQDRSIVFIDEAHEMKRAFQTALYRALDHRKLFIGGSRSKPETIRIADFSLLLATTDEYLLLQPLRDRMKLVLRFDFYSPQELTTILLHRSRSLGWDTVETVLPLISGRAKGTPRMALRLLQAARRVCRAEGETTIRQEHLERACLLEQIDSLGLGPTEQRYLSLLAAGNTRLNVVGSMLGLPPRTVSQVTEPFLIRAGLVVKDDYGRRQLTAKGREHLLNHRQSGA